MAALSASRNTVRQGAPRQKITVSLKAAAKVFKGGIVAVDATGFGIAGATATSLIVMGIAQADVDNTSGANGALTVDVETGEFKLDNSGGDAVLQAHVGSDCFMVDDHTVSETNGSSTESRAGKVVRLDADGSPWVLLGLGF